MKIIKCHISGFGKIINKDYDFQDNFNQIIENNGFGKSTLANFIKAMFYGFDTARGDNFVDRIHYIPFNGGEFGGNITFEYNNQIYNIERYFDKKTNTKDTLKVFCNETETNDLGDDIGEKIFGIDKMSFDKVLFITSDKIELKTTTDISKKINNDVNDVNDDFDLKKITNKIKEASIKKTIIEQASENARNYYIEIENLKKIDVNLVEKHNRQNKFKEEIHKLEEQIKEEKNKKIVLEKWETYDKYLEEAKKYDNFRKVLDEKYVNGFPSDGEIVTIKDAIDSMNVNSGILEENKLSKEEQENYSNLDLLFKGKVPTNKDINDIKEDIKELDSKQKSLNDAKPYDEKIFNKFNNKPITNNFLEELEGKFKDYSSLKEKCNSSNNVIDEEKNDKKSHKLSKLNILILISSIVLIGLGIGLLFVSIIPGIICIILGVIALIIFFALYFKDILTHNSNVQYSSNNMDKIKVMTIKNELIRLEGELRTKLIVYDYTDEDILYAYRDFKKDYDKYNLEKPLKEEYDQKIEKMKNDIESLKSKIDGFLNLFDKTNLSYSDRLNNVNVNINLYNALLARKNEIEAKDSKYKELQINRKRDLEEIKKKYQLDELNEDVLEIIKTDKNNYSNYIIRVEDEKKNASKYKTDNNLTDRPIINENFDFEGMNEKLEDKKQDLYSLNQEVNNDEEELETLSEKEDKFEKENQKIQDYKNKNKIYDATKKLLEEAEQNQKDKYVKPIKDKFVKYSEIIKDVIGETIYMDKEYQLTYDVLGKQRPVNHLSSGELSLCALCYRMALIDNMFKSELPFIIMDDPFVHLDDRNLKKMNKLIKDISKDKQIIYLCCSESRKI